MASEYSQDLRIELIANGEQSGTWGNTTNNNLGTLIEDAIAGVTTYTTAASPYTLTALNGVADQARNAVLSLNTSTGANYIVIVPTVTKTYIVKNNSSLYTLTVKTSAGTGVAIPPLKAVLVRCDGTNVVESLNHVVDNFSLGGTLTTAGDTTLSGALSVAKPVTVLTSAFLGSSQTATISVASPSIITVASAPASGTAVVFTTSNTLPTGLTVGTVYYVSNINSTTFNVSTSSTLSPLVNVTVAGSGTHTVANISLALTPPTASNSTQIATTEYVTTAVANSIVSYQTKTAVLMATTAALATNTYSNGSSGVGATLTGTATGALAAIDGVTPAVGNRVLVKNESSTLKRGVYVVTNPGAVGVSYVLTRATDCDTSAKLAAALVPVLSGTTNGGLSYVTTFKSTNTVGTTAVSWEKLLSGLIDTDEISDGAVTTAKIADGNVTAAKLDGAQTGAAPIYGVRAWASFNGSTGAINASGNVASIVRASAGRYTITFTTAMDDVNYAVSAIGYNTNPDGEAYAHVLSQTTTNFQIQFSNTSDARVDSSTYTSVMVVR